MPRKLKECNDEFRPSGMDLGERDIACRALHLFDWQGCLQQLEAQSLTAFVRTESLIGRGNR